MLIPRSCVISPFFFFNDTATTEIYTLSLHDALPISPPVLPLRAARRLLGARRPHRHPRLLFPDGPVLAHIPEDSGIGRGETPEPEALGQGGVRRLHHSADPHPLPLVPSHGGGCPGPGRPHLGLARPSGRRVHEI